MRVTIATRIFHPEAAAAAFRLTALARALAESGHEVVVLTTRSPESSPSSPEVFGEGSVRVRRSPALRDATGQIRGYVQYLSFDIPLFFRMLFGRSSDVVVVEPPPTTGMVVRVVCAIRRRPYVYYAADIWSDAAGATGAPGFVVRALRAAESAAMRRARTVIAVNEEVARRVRTLGGHDRVTVVRNGIDTTVFRPDGEIVATGPIAVYAGTASEWQGAEVFIRALPLVRSTIPDARLVFIGQGSAWDELRSIAATEAGDAVEFIDTSPPAVAASWLRSARVGLASIRPGQNYEIALPTKVFASAACGTPVLFAGGGEGARFVRDERTGTAVAYDVDAVAVALTTMLAADPGPDARMELGRSMAQRVGIVGTARSASAVVESVAADIRRR